MTAVPDDPWTHGALQKDLYQRRRRRPSTAAWLEINISKSDDGRLDVFEARYHDARNRTTFVGFEVKATRQDLESDLASGKWRRYLHVCDELYFAVPKGLADLSVIPDVAGVIVRTGTRLDGQWRVGRKPQGGHRTVDDVDIWRRLALRENWNPPVPVKTRLERMREYAELKSLSHLVSHKVIGELQRRESDIQRKTRELERMDDRRAALEALENQMRGLSEKMAAANQLIRSCMVDMWPMQISTSSRPATLEDAIAVLTSHTQEAK